MTLTLPDQERLAAIEGRLRDLGFPRQLVVENRSYCNLRCVHCCHKEMVRPRRHMERGLWNKIVEEVGRERPECELWPGPPSTARPSSWDGIASCGAASTTRPQLDAGISSSTPTARSLIAGTIWRRSWPRRSAASS